MSWLNDKIEQMPLTSLEASMHYLAGIGIQKMEVWQCDSGLALVLDYYGYEWQYVLDGDRYMHIGCKQKEDIHD